MVTGVTEENPKPCEFYEGSVGWFKVNFDSITCSVVPTEKRVDRMDGTEREPRSRTLKGTLGERKRLWGYWGHTVER